MNHFTFIRDSCLTRRTCRSVIFSIFEPAAYSGWVWIRLLDRLILDIETIFNNTTLCWSLAWLSVEQSWGKCILSGCPAWAGPIYFSAVTIYSKWMCMKSERTSQAKTCACKIWWLPARYEISGSLKRLANKSQCWFMLMYACTCMYGVCVFWKCLPYLEITVCLELKHVVNFFLFYTKK